MLAEIRTDKACEMLCNLLEDENQNTEIRAGAAWGLGELNQKNALSALIHSFESTSENIKMEAARALRKLTKDFTSEIVDKFQHSTFIQRPGLAWALSEAESLSIGDLLKCLSDVDSRHWSAYILGVQGEEKYIGEIEKLKEIDPEVYFATTVLWKIMTSWVYGLKEY